MSELVKGITIPDGTYREYAKDDGPSIIPNGLDLGTLNAGPGDFDVTGLRLKSDLRMEFAQGENTATSTVFTATQTGRAASVTVDLTTFEAGESGQFYFIADADEKLTLNGVGIFIIKPGG